MRLSDIMSNTGLQFYPQMALILFLVAFALICARVFLFSSKSEMDRAARIPLYDGDDDDGGAKHDAGAKT